MTERFPEAAGNGRTAVPGDSHSPGPAARTEQRTTRERPATSFGTIARHGRGWLPLIAAAALAGSLGSLALPYVLGRAVDAIVAGDAALTGLVLLAGGLIALGVASDLVDAFAGTACVAGTAAWLRDRLVRHVLAIGPGHSSRFETGDLVSRVSSNAVDAAHAGPSLVTAGTAVLPPVGSLVLLAYMDIWLAVAFLAGVAMVVVVLWLFTRRTADILTDYQTTLGKLAGRLGESLAGARTIAAAGTVEPEIDRVLEPLPDLHAQGVRTWRVLASSVAQSAIVGPFVLVAVLSAGGLGLAAGRISAGELFAATQYAMLGAGLGSLTAVFGELARSRAGVRRADELLGVRPIGYGGRALPVGCGRSEGRLEFRGVTARAGGQTVLHEVDVTVPGGALVAVVGRSGAGKSMLAALAARLRDPDQGAVLLDGVPLTELDHTSLRTAVGCAFERPVLVGETLDQVIGLGLDRPLVESAARATHAHEFVCRLPDGYDTPLVQAPMSGGEAQRLGIARAWHAERLLVLDDATSSLDMITELRVGSALDESGRTRLVVTHRVSTAAHADLVVWLENGRVRGFGPHGQLWDDIPAYREVFG